MGYSIKSSQIEPRFATKVAEIGRAGPRLITLRHHLARELAAAAQSIPADARVLDAGAGDSPYRTLFDQANYEATDICVRKRAHDFQHVSIVCPLHDIPVEDNRYDLVICTQVLEHVPNPLEVLTELYRVLKPNARLWISAPLFFEEHEVPYDFFRYTQYFWKEHMPRIGFDIERITPLQGYGGTVGHQLNLASRNLPTRPKYYGGGMFGFFCGTLALVAKLPLRAYAWALCEADRTSPLRDFGHTTDYLVVARKTQILQ